MCGIVGYVGRHKAAPILLEGLRRLEYRGYDSAGLAVVQDRAFAVLKRAGRVEDLVRRDAPARLSGSVGISHTRWATHGGVTDVNAHPHLSSDGRFALVHNGVVENYVSIQRFLAGKGYQCVSETDTEVLVNLIAYHYQKEPVSPDSNRFVEAVRKTLRHVEGTYGIAVLCTDHPGEIVGARKGSPLILGVGDHEYILASDPLALATRTLNAVILNDGELVHLTETGFAVLTAAAEDVEPKISRLTIELEKAELGDFAHFMEKEIFEQPVSLENSMRGRFSDDESTAKFGGLNLSPAELRQVDRMVFLGCGTAWHACLVAEHLIERFARIPVEVEYASEFRYRNSPLDKNTLVFVISQSGETMDTLFAMREAKRKGYRALAIVNVVGSTIAREADGGVYQHAGPEIGVASTKAFTSQIALAAMMALYFGRLRDLSFSDGVAYVEALKGVPALARRVLQQASTIQEIARRYAHYKDMLFLGRGMSFPLALEGALKLKEISYMHAEGYPAAEMKHGPLALVSAECPCLFFVPPGELFPKTVSNMQECKARGARLLAVAHEGAEFPPGLVDDLITLPACHEAVRPILQAIPVQLLSYYIAVELGRDVDKPRNLAKSVTVE